MVATTEANGATEIAISLPRYTRRCTFDEEEPSSYLSDFACFIDGYASDYEETKELFWSAKQYEIDSEVKPIRVVLEGNDPDSVIQPFAFGLKEKAQAIVALGTNSVVCCFAKYDSPEETYQLWDLKDGVLLQTFNNDNSGPCTVMAAVDENTFLSAGPNCKVNIWSRADEKKPFEYIRSIDHDRSSILSMLVLHQWNIVVTGSGDHAVRLWQLSSSECVKTLRGHTGEVRALCELPRNHGTTDHVDTPNLIISGADDDSIKLWSFGGALHRTIKTKVRFLTVLKKRRILISCSSSPTIKFWNPDTRTCIKKIPAHTRIIFTVVELIEDEVLVSGTYGNEIKLWNMEGDCLYRIDGDSAEDIVVVAQGFVSLTLSNTLHYWKT